MNTTSTDRDTPAHEPSSSPTEYDDKLPKLSHAARAYKQLSQTESFQDSVRTPECVSGVGVFGCVGAGFSGYIWLLGIYRWCERSFLGVVPLMCYRLVVWWLDAEEQTTMPLRWRYETQWHHHTR